MNLLPITFMFMIVFGFFFQFFVASHLKTTILSRNFLTYMKAHSRAISLREQYLYHSYIADGVATKYLQLYPPKEKKYFRKHITQNSKFNLFPLLKDPTTSLLKKALSNLMDDLYGKKTISSSYNLQVFKKRFFDRLMQLHKEGKLENLEYLQQITFPEPLDQEYWEALLDGKPIFISEEGKKARSKILSKANTWPPFGDYITVQKDNPKAFVLQKAHRKVLQAFLGKTATKTIIELETNKKKQDPQKKSAITEAEWNSQIKTGRLLFEESDLRKIMHVKAQKITDLTIYYEDPHSGMRITLLVK